MAAAFRRLLGNVIVVDGARILTVNVAGAGLAFLSHILFARWLGVASYGNYVYALSWLNVLAVVVQLGLNIAVVRLIAEYRAADSITSIHRLIRFSNRVVLIAGLAVAGIGAALIAQFTTESAQELRTTLYLTLGLTIVLGLFQQRMAVLQGFERVFEAQAFHELARPALLILAAVAASRWDGFDASTVMGLNLAVTGLVLVGLVRYAGKLLATAGQGAPDTAAPRPPRWLAIGLPYLIVTIVAIGLTQTDVLMIGSLIGPEQAGLYAPAAKVAMLVIFPAMAVRARIAPMVARLYADGDREAVQNRITVATLASLGTCIVGVIIIVAARDFILGLFGDAFRASDEVLIILALGYCIYTLGTSVETFLLMGPFERINAAVLLITLVANLLLNAFLIPYMGILGAAWATVGAMMLRAVLSTLIVFRRTGVLPIRFGRSEVVT
ncbi:MAG: hypothetical protein CMM77_08415 [Rhodospirillaceae bacterium]|nr:hypothetical protein [Magnetovibrio sp.]MAY67137.1 hypothetical protein [Rhodospirillaceae bacterium]